jgi:arginine decarboxylase
MSAREGKTSGAELAPGIPRPTKFYLTSGSSEGYTPLNAFDGALLNADVGDVNLVRLSSILPPRCRRVREPWKHEGGALTPVAYASITSHLPGETIAAAVAVAVPKNPDEPGVVMEYSARGTAESAEKIVRQMAKEAFKIRGRELRQVLSTSVEHRVEHIGSTFAAVVFGY